MPSGVAGLRMRRRCRHCFHRLSSGWRPADTNTAEEALDAAEADLVSDGEFEGGGSGAIGTPHRLDHVFSKSFAETPRCRAACGVPKVGLRHLTW